MIRHRLLRALNGSLQRRRFKGGSVESEKAFSKPVERAKPRSAFGELASSPQYYHVEDGNNCRATSTSLQDPSSNVDFLCVSAYNKYGFRLSNETFVVGPMVLIGQAALSWKVASVDEISEDSLALLTALNPKPGKSRLGINLFDNHIFVPIVEIAILGVGDENNVSKLKKRFESFFEKTNISLEIMSTPDACPMINYLNSDQRSVVAMLFPVRELPKRISSTLDSGIERALSREATVDVFAFMAGLRAKSLPKAYQDLISERREELNEEKAVKDSLKNNT